MSPLDERISQMPSISLTELNERSALMRRTDRKYVVTQQVLLTWLDDLGGSARVLDIDGRRSFRYSSMYFDTPERDSFRASAHKRRRRFKIRVRSYLDTDAHFIEVKVRDARSQTLKSRVPCSAELLGGLTEEARGFVQERLRHNGLDGDLADRVLPIMETHFTRTTLHIAGFDARITIDRALDVREPEGKRLDFPGLIIVETKSGSHGTSADRALWAMGVRPQRVSKFAIGSALLDPSLPDNKWSRTVRRGFPNPEPCGADVALSDH